MMNRRVRLWARPGWLWRHKRSCWLARGLMERIASGQPEFFPIYLVFTA
jgi:hypothetical protein